MYISIPDRYAEQIQDFCNNNNHESINSAANELIRLGLLAYDMILKSNFNPKIVLNKDNFKYEISPYLPTEFLEQKRFLTQLPVSFADTLDTFRDVNNLANRSMALSVLLRIAILRYHEIPDKEKPSITILKPLKNREKTLILSDDKELFLLLENFQKEIRVKQRSTTILFLIQLMIDEIMSSQ